MVGLVQQVLAGRAAVIAPQRKGPALLRRQVVGDLGKKLLRGRAGAVLRLGLTGLGSEELLLVEGLGKQRLDGLLARRADLAPVGTEVPPLLGRLLPDLLAALRGKGAGIAQKIGNDCPGGRRGLVEPPDRTGHRADDHEVEGERREQKTQHPARRPPLAAHIGIAGVRHSRSSSRRSTCAATTRLELPREIPVISSSAGTTPCERLDRPRYTPSASEAASMPAAPPNAVRDRRAPRARNDGNDITLVATRLPASPPAALASTFEASGLATGTMRGERRAAARIRSASAASLASDGMGARSSARSSASASASILRAARSRATSWPAPARASTGQRARSLP